MKWIFRRLRTVAKNVHNIRHVCPSIRPPASSSAVPSVDGCPWSFRSVTLRKIRRENPNLLKVEKKRPPYTKTRIVTGHVNCHRAFWTAIWSSRIEKEWIVVFRQQKCSLERATVLLCVLFSVIQTYRRRGRIKCDKGCRMSGKEQLHFTCPLVATATGKTSTSSLDVK